MPIRETAMDPVGHRYETPVVGAAEAERFNTAVYLYLERKAGQQEVRSAVIRSVGGTGARRKCVSLWSSEAVQDFALFWRSFRNAPGPRR